MKKVCVIFITQIDKILLNFKTKNRKEALKIRFLEPLKSNLKSKLQNATWRNQNGGRIFKKSANSPETCYIGVFWV